MLQPKYGGMVIDVVSRDIRTPEQQSEALTAVKNAALAVVLIVVLGYGQFYQSFLFFDLHRIRVLQIIP